MVAAMTPELQTACHPPMPASLAEHRRRCVPAAHGIVRSIVVGVLALAGLLASPRPAAQEQPSDAVTEPRFAAVSFALTMDLVAAALSSTCAEAGAELSQKAEDAHASWKVRNGQLVDSAHQYLLFVSSTVAAQQGEEAGRAFYAAQRARFVADAQTALTDTYPGGDIDAAVCDKVLSNLGGGAMDLEAKPEFFKALVEIDQAISHMRQR
jgi:hypothetical protein